MRIGIDGRLFGPRVGGGGLGRYVEQLILHLEKLDQENEYVIFLGRENWDDYQPIRPNFKKILAPWRWYTLAEQIKMPGLVDQARLDLIHYPHFNVPIFSRTPFVVTIHDLNLLEYPKTGVTNLDPFRFWAKYLGYRLVLSYALRRAKKIIAVSEATRQAILKKFSITTNRVVVTPLGYTLPPPTEANETQNHLLQPTTYNLQPNAYLLTVGNSYPHKNLSGLLRAFIKILAKFPDLKLILAGPEDRFRTRLKKEADSLGLTSSVVFTGFVSDAELDALYQKAAAYIMPSFLEGFGLPGLEAQARGRPVLASNLQVLKETYGPGALYFDPNQPQEMAQVILQLLSDPTLAARLVAAGQENIKRFDWSQTARKTREIYWTGAGSNR